MAKRDIARKAALFGARQVVRKSPAGRALLTAHKVGKGALRAKRFHDRMRQDEPQGDRATS